MLEAILRKANLWDVFIIVLSSLAIVGFWRGVWNLLDRYLLPNSFVYSQVVSIVAGVIILVILSRYR